MSARDGQAWHGVQPPPAEPAPPLRERIGSPSDEVAKQEAAAKHVRVDAAGHEMYVCHHPDHAARRVFPIDPASPTVAYRAFRDHMDAHDRDRRPDLPALRAELTGLIARISMRPEQLGDLLGMLLSYVPIHDWASLEVDLRREFGVPGPAIVPTDTAG